MLMPTGLKGKEREKYIKDHPNQLRKANVGVHNKYAGLRVAKPSKSQAEKQKVEAKVHLDSIKNRPSAPSSR